MSKVKVGDMVRLSFVGSHPSSVRTQDESQELRKYLHSIGTVVACLSPNRYVIGFTSENIEFKCLYCEFEHLA